MNRKAIVVYSNFPSHRGFFRASAEACKHSADRYSTARRAGYETDLSNFSFKDFEILAMSTGKT